MRSPGVKNVFLVLTITLGVAAAAQTAATQGPSAAPARKSPVAAYAGAWTASFDGKVWLTVQLTSQADKVTGFLRRPRNVQFNDLGEVRSVSDEESTETVQAAEVNPDGLLLTTKDPDTQETNRYTMKLTGDSTAEIKMNAMKIPPGMPKIKPWRLTKAAAGPPAAQR
jgi:hypothetical protein